MDIIKILGVGILGVILTNILKSAKSELSVFVVIGTGTIILLMLMSGLKDVILTFENLIDRTGISEKLYSSILKIIGIGYLTEFASSICDDFNASSISKKLLLSGKIAIFVMAIPIMDSLLSVVEKLISL